MTFTTPASPTPNGPEMEALGRWPERQPTESTVVKDALEQAREAIGVLLSALVVSPVAVAFEATHGLLDAAETYRLVETPLTREALLREIALGLGHPRLDPLLRDTTERVAERYLRCYARNVTHTGLGAAYQPRSRPDLTELPSRLQDSFGRRVRLRGPKRHGPKRERRWLGPQRRIHRDGIEERLEELARWAADPLRDPIVTAAYLYARILDLHPYTYANAPAAHLAGDLALRALPGVSAARIGLGNILTARLPEHRPLMRDALDEPHQVEPWLVAYADAVHDAAKATTRLLERHHAAHRAVRERLRGPDGQALLGRRRIDQARLADLAARTPYLSIPMLTFEGLAQRRAASGYLSALVRLGLGSEVQHGPYRLVRISSLADVFLAETDITGARDSTAQWPLATLKAAARRKPPIDPYDP